jgi:hypothetical protein
LPALHAHVLVGFRRDHEAGAPVPPLPLWANLLRVVADDTVRLGDLHQRARLSRRTTGPLVAEGERAGLLSVDRSGGRGTATARLTPSGLSALAAGRAGLERTEAVWHERLGEPVARLRRDLESLVGRLTLELAHHPAGYGPADTSITGGMLAAADGPMPAHGKDWRPVRRDGPDTAAGLPLSALLSQALVAFAVDYERGGGVTHSLATAAVLATIDDEGRREADLPPLAAWRPGHGMVEVGVPPGGRRRLVHLTARGRAARDEHVRLVAEVESRWRDRFGSEVTGSLRSSCSAIATDLGRDLPPYPFVGWIAGLPPPAP